ncbi:MAG: hypothetical protein AB8E74_03455 [Prochlorococcus sp.]|nr:hypothetical protein [Prochlorococcaceae cyanobacterium Fu_MAG_50]
MVKRRHSKDPKRQQRSRLEHCWQLECDIDPLILRARLLHWRHQLRFASAVEEEMLPIV